MPGRAIRNRFLERVQEGRIPVKGCFRCLEHCNPAETPYCITRALIHAAEGNIEEALLFCGKQRVPVQEDRDCAGGNAEALRRGAGGGKRINPALLS